MEVSIREVEDAVNQFYENPSEKADVHTWLTQAQHSPQAWNFAFQLLDPSKSGEVQFFGGNTLYLKISRHLHEVPQEEYDGLKRRLLELLAQYADNKAILGRLLKAMAAFILNTMEREWPTALKDLIATFNPETCTVLPPDTAMDLLFRLLMIIPDELENCTENMGISKTSKNALRGLLKNNSKGVLTLMQQVMHANQVSNVTKETVIKALEAWLRIPIPLSDTKDLLVALIPYSNYGLLCESVVDCIRTALTETDTVKLPNTVMDFVMQLLQLTSVLDEALNAEDENTASIVYSLFTSILESHARLLLQMLLEDQGDRKQAVLQLITLLVQCCGTPGQYPTQETLSNIPFSVWYTVQDELMTFEDDERDQLMALLAPVYLRLVDTFLQKSLVPPDEALSAEERELFRCYRQDICDSYMYTYFILKCRMLEQLERHLQNAVVRIQRDPSDWRPLESLLHAYASVAETVADSDTYYVPRFIQSIPQIPFGENVNLITVALSTLGAYADWLNFHQDHLQHVIPLMVEGLVNERLVGAASQALRDLTLECPLTITPFAGPILDACQKALNMFPRVEGAVKERIITIIARVLSVGVAEETVIAQLNTTLTPIIANIAHIRDSHAARGSYTKQERVMLVSQLKLLSCLARHLNINVPIIDSSSPGDSPSIPSPPITVQRLDHQPLLIVLKPLMPILDALAVTTATVPDLVEVLCKLLKNSISTLTDGVEPLLPGLLTMLPRLYYTSVHPAVLDIVKLIVVLFGSAGSEHVQDTAQLVEGVINYTLQRVNRDLWNYTHVVHGLLSLATHLCKKHPHLLHPHHLHALLGLGIEALKLPEDGTIRSASSFLHHFLMLSREHKGAIYEPVVRHNVEHFLRTIFTCICNSPRHGLSPVSELLHSLCKLYGGQALMATFMLLEEDDTFLSNRINREHKHKFAKAVLRANSVKQTVAAVTDLALVSRGVAGTEYGAATSQQMQSSFH